MSNPMTEGETRTAFDELLHSELPRFAPPGTAAAHRTVRRRRRGSAGAAGLALVAFLGAGYLAVTGIDLSGSDRSRPVDAGWNSVPPEELVVGGDPELTRLAANAVRFDDPSNPAVAGGIEELTPDGGGPFTYGPGSGGTFLVRISCAGPGGSVTLIAQASGRNDQHRATAQCATNAGEVASGVGETTIEIGDPDDIEFSLIRNGTAEWGAGDIWPIVARTITLL